ncbi:BtuB Outer membrane cobalamin receptor protein [Rhabdaerophilaceae bacterium]
MFRTKLAAFVASASLCGLASVVSAQTNPSPTAAPAPLDINVTANRLPTAIQRTGSAITVISAQEIARASALTINDMLRQVPGLEISETGGPGSTATVRLRGANSGQTLVLLDGMRLNDPSGASGEFDASTIAPGLVDRIEVLRGPQSALYGSDAMGGVINIITRKGRGAPSASVRTEFGSYGTIATSGSLSGGSGAWSYAFSGLGQRTEGFSRYGYRIGRLERGRGPFDDDSTTRFGGVGRLGYDPGTGFRFDLGVVSTFTRAEYDAAFGAFPDTPSYGRRYFNQASARVELDTHERMLTHAIQIFANRTERQFFDSSFGTLTGGARGAERRTRSDFIGDRYGAEYLGTLRLNQFGSVLFGARTERETAETFSQTLLPTTTARVKTLGGGQTTNSLFSLWQLPVGERLTLSLGGRYDAVTSAKTFATWRATAAYAFAETGTKLRASAGTGGKAATLFQRYSPDYGTPGLRPEHSVGFDAGIDQSLFNGRLAVSATAFSNRFRDLITFESGPKCLATQIFGCYVNVARATTSGIELSARAVILEGWLSASGTYTYLHAKDRSTNLTLPRRTPHSGRVALQITPLPGLTIEPSVTMTSARFSSANERAKLAPFARLDILAEYSVNGTYKVHARAENLTNARYEDVQNYGTTGRAFYGGLTATW